MGGFADMFSTVGGFTTGTPGGFMNVLGPGGMGLTGSTQSGSTQVQLDPTTQALNTLRLNNLLNMGGSVGGFENLIPQVMQSSQFSGDTTSLINNAMNLSAVPGMQPGDWFNQALGSIDPTQQINRLNSLTNANSGNLSITLQSELGQGGGMLNATLGQNLGALQNLQPQLLGAGNDYFHQILGPQIQNQNSLMGLGRSGANEEAQAKGAASISLPIAQLMAQLTQQAYGQYGSGLQSLYNNAYSGYNQGAQSLMGQNQQAQSSLGSQYLQNIYGINQAYPGVSTGLQGADLQRSLLGVNASDLQRQATAGTLQNLLQGYVSGMNATPYQPTQSTKTTGTGDTGILTSVLGGGGGAGIGAAAGKMMMA